MTNHTLCRKAVIRDPICNFSENGSLGTAKKSLTSPLGKYLKDDDGTKGEKKGREWTF